MLRERVVISEIAGREIPTREAIDDVTITPTHQDRLRFSVGWCSLAPEQSFQYCAGCGLLYDCLVEPGIGRLCAICRARRHAGVAAA